MAEKAEKEKKAEAKLLDEKDEAFCGFVHIQVLDQDGMQQKTLGGNVKAPLHMVSGEGTPVVELEAHFGVPVDPLFYLEVRNEENFFLWGQWWMDAPKWSEMNSFCNLVPIKTTDCHKNLEKSGNNTCTAQALCPFLKNSPDRLFEVTFTTKELKFKTKLTKATIKIPREAWTEWKQYRVRMWKSGKNWQGQEEKDDDKDKDKDKDKDEK